MGLRTWLVGAYDEHEGLVYLVRIDREGTFHGWQSADLSGVIDCLYDAAYATFIDEEADTYTVYRLTDMGPVPVKIESQQQHEWVNVRLSWRQPGVSGKAAVRKVDSFYKIPGA